MEFPIIAPKLGWGTEPLELVEWKAKEGSWIEKGTSILTITTKKITSDIIAEHSGYLHISVEEGKEAPIGSVVGFVVETKEELERLQKESSKVSAPNVAEPEKIPSAEVAPVQVTKEPGRFLISPAARKLAEEHVIDVSGVLGTGPAGAIVREDIEKAIKERQQTKAAMSVFPGKKVKSTIPLKGMRKAIAEHMKQSLSVSAQLTVMGEIDMTETVKVRQALLRKYEPIGVRITYTDIFVFIIAKLLKKYPIINASLINDEIKLWENINVGVAVALEEGLIVPVIKDADKKSLEEISRDLKSLTEKAKLGQLVLDDATGGTFTITNLGALGGGYRFETVIINQPESAILGTGGISDRAIVRDQKIVIRPIMTYYFTYDHRVVNGAVAAQFIADLTNLFEKPGHQMFEEGSVREIEGSKTFGKDVNGAKYFESSRTERKQKDLISHLNQIVGTRITTSDFERWFYRSDFLSIPNWIRQLFKTTPVAVVKPKTAQEISAILIYCSQHKIPVVARGGGSAGVFGAVPKKGGIVLDMTDLTDTYDVDTERLQVTTAAGITWWELDNRLKSHGLAVKSYPSSARSATIGGWIMGSGLGLGSLKYGTVFEQILSAEIVLADGSIKEYNRGQGLELFFETEGMLGILTKVTLEVRRLPESTSHHLVYFDKAKNLFDFLPALVKTAPCPYAVEIIDYNYLTLLKASGFETTNFSVGSGVALIAYEGGAKEIEAGNNTVKKLAPLFHGEEREGADQEWRHRFNMLRVRRAAPTIIPSSVRVPLTALDKFYSSLEKLKRRPIGLLGHVISQNECILMPMVVSDERKTIEYTFALHMPREISNLALSVGGKPSGGLGVWNAPYYRQMLPSERVKEIKNKKRELDQEGILNPGMWFEPPLLFKPRIYQLAMSIASVLDRIVPAGTVKKKNKNFRDEISTCTQCGYCVNYCPTKGKWLSSTPRGRILKTGSFSSRQPKGTKEITQDYVNSVFNCTLCGRCRTDCPVNIESPKIWMDLRNELVEKGFEPESLKPVIANIERTHNILSKPNDQRANWSKQLKLPHQTEGKNNAKVIYFVGCVTSLYPEVQGIARSFANIMNSAGVDFAILGGEEWCCGYPLLSSGHQDAMVKSMEHNIAKVKEMEAESVVMTCPGCYRVWKHEYSDIAGKGITFDVFHSTEFIAKLIKEGRIKIGEMENRVTYHDPCDIGRNSILFEEPRYIINKIPGVKFVELKNNREYCSCCGAGGELLVSNPDLSAEVARRKVSEILETKTQTLVTACPTCIMALNAAKAAEKAEFDILDITQLVEKAVIREGNK